MVLFSLTLATVIAAASPPAVSLPKNCTKAVAFVGTICTPSTPGKHPAIVLLGGSEGGDFMAREAPRFSARGYVAASVAYFGLPGLPPALEEIPVETVGKALTAIAKRDDVDPDRIGLLGGSKGGEFALLAASTYSQFHAVVADIPSPFAWEGIPQGPGATPQSSWSVHGKPVPFVAYAPSMGQMFATAFMQHTPLVLRPAYDDSMKDTTAVKAAFFHLEKCTPRSCCSQPTTISYGTPWSSAARRKATSPPQTQLGRASIRS